ncbi:FUSC family protein [Ancylobacter sp. G4_0304]|uniref:FUSC family protein n=1 Tax=Ancylobacter sp. G4_0304 TaxID=3114289 RepID=UPI0039C6E2B9
MSVAERAGLSWRATLPVDLGWRNFVFSARTALAAILALAIAYWLELSDPQWATLTVYLLAQPTVGAALAKSAWRVVGTVSGALLGLVLVALFSQAAELLVAATCLTVAVSHYLAARQSNYAAYGFLLGGFTALLVAYEGALAPNQSWTIAIDRTAEILIGIACSAGASLLVMPRYAGDALREAMGTTFTGLSAYVAAALRLSTSMTLFAALRQRMVAVVVSFDALRSYTLFEAPEMRVDEQRLTRTVREFLVVLAIARGVFFRLDGLNQAGASEVMARLRPTLEATAARVEAIAADPKAWSEPARLRRDLLAARTALARAADEMEALAGTLPFEPLANGLLVLRRAGDLVHGLAMVVVSEAASVRARRVGIARRAPTPQAASERREALFIATRAGLAVAILSLVWMATTWDQGFNLVAGGAIMLFFAVNQDDPLSAARYFIYGTIAGLIVAYGLMVFVQPHLEGFEALAVMFFLALLPAGLIAGTPGKAWIGIALGGYTIAQVGTSNLFAPDEPAFINSALALLLGLVISLCILAAMPVTSRARRGESWQRAIGAILPAVARGALPARRGAGEIRDTLALLLPRLSLDRQGDDDFLRGTLGAASCAIELGRLLAVRGDPAMPEPARQRLDQFLSEFAVALEALAQAPGERSNDVARAEALANGARADLAAQVLEPGSPAARAVLRAGASLRFITDRFYIDRAYWERRRAQE